MSTAILLLLLTAAQLPQTTPPRDAAPSKRGSAAITGRITEDESGRPVARAIVTLLPNNGSTRRETVTDADGRYEFSGLEAGEYGVSAGPGELRATHLRQAFGRSSPMTLFSLPPRSGVAVKDGEVRSGVDVALRRALAIEGRVLDSRDQPMSNVQVHLVRPDGSPEAGDGAYSDDRGAFRLYGLRPGRYRVCASAQGQAEPRWSDSSRFVRTCHPASLTPANAADVILTTTDAVGVDIRVQRRGTFTLSGSIVDAAGDPADGVRLNASELEDRSVSSGGTGTGGRFVLNGLTPGRYIVTASLGGPANPGDTRPPKREREFGYAFVDVSGTDVTGLTIALSKDLNVSGRVSFDGPTPSTPNGLRMQVHAAVLDPAMLQLIGRPRSAAVDEKLRFELTGIQRLPLVLGMSGLPEGWVLRSVRLGEQDITDVPTDFGAAPQPPRLEIVVTNQVARPRVRVVDDEGRPVIDYRLSVLPADPTRWNGWLRQNMNQPNGEGVLKLDAIVPGDYLVAALTPDEYNLLIYDSARFPDSPRTRLNDLAAVSTRVTFGEGDERTIDLRMTALPALRR